MALTVGTQLGSHEITGLLGKGGMGEVYRARDLKLKREVAIKILPEEFSCDADRVNRFQREAQVLASLNHPNIAQIYGLEQSGASNCIVMELVEGETLAERIASGPVAADDAMQIAKQLIDALEAAHDRGIVHRDLKPANIKLTHDGKVKVLDFGLAKALDDANETPVLSHSPTKLSGSMVGVVLGTAAYMSPEQARGKVVDARTDIWAFGCILFEMLSGRQVFAGDTTTEIIAKVLEREPDWGCLPVHTAHSTRLLLEATLNKDPKLRVRNIVDARLFLNLASRPETSTSVIQSPRSRRRATVVAAVLGVLPVATAIPAALYFVRRPAEAPEMRFEMLAPSLSLFNGFPLAISPDGSHIAYTAISGGKKSIWIRPINSLTAQQLPGTDNGDNPFWSPDSRYVAFFSDGNLKKIDVAGGPATTICATFTNGGTWNRDGIILVTASQTAGLPGIARVSSSGGELTQVTRPDASRKEVAHFQPQFLPDGKHFLYLTVTPENPQALAGTIYAASLDSKETTKILTFGAGTYDIPPRYVEPGYLLFTRNGTLLAQPFDAEHLKVTGEASTLVERSGFFAASNNILIYQKDPLQAAAFGLQQLTWFDRKGNPVGKIAMPSDYREGLELSPDGHRAAVSIASNTGAVLGQDIWILDLDRSVPNRMTFDSSYNNGAVWAPDGTRIAFGSSRGGGLVPDKVFRKMAAGVGNDELLHAFESGDGIYLEDWSRDSQHIMLELTKISRVIIDLWDLPLSGDKKPFAYLKSPYDKLQAKFSPNGHFVAYSTNESGIYQIVVQTFPDPNGGKWQITANGGMEPRWRRDGRELYYLSLDGKLMAATVRVDSTFQSDQPVMLFQTPLSLQLSIPFPTRYDVMADGQRFLMPVPVSPQSNTSDTNTTLVAVINWTNAFRKK